MIALTFTIYFGTGFAYWSYSLFGGWIEMSFGEFIYHMLLWPLDLACAVEQRLGKQ